jgi:hypothetical protein
LNKQTLNKQTLVESLQFKIRSVSDAMLTAAHARQSMRPGHARYIGHLLRQAGNALKATKAALPLTPCPLFENCKARLTVDRAGKLHVAGFKTRRHPQPLTMREAARLVALWQTRRSFRFAKV